MKQSILDKFDLTEKDFLGSGGESWVYRLDNERILRIDKGDAQRHWYVEASKEFYDALPDLDFALPTVYSVGEHDGSIYSVENKIEGNPLSERLPGLKIAKKQEALANYLAAVEALKETTYPESPYGEILTKKPVTAPTWRGFLATMVNNAVAKNDLRSDVPRLGEVTDITLAMIARLSDPAKALVHGDYFPGNMLVNSDLEVTGVIYFSPMTVIGDPLMDVAGSLLFLEVLDAHVPEDSEILHSIIVRKYGPDIDNTIRLYRLYYSFYFSGARDDTRLYRWCIDNLNGNH